ncbi:MAG: hypothetical protein ACSLFR_00085 [Solirubrobacteraceae bacterium]
MLIACNDAIRRHGRRVMTGAAALVLASALMLAHGAAGAAHGSGAPGPAAMGAHDLSMGAHHPPAGADHGGMSLDQALAMCLAITETAAFGFALLAVIAAWRCTLHRLSVITPRMAAVSAAVVPPRAAARAGPAVLQVFLR